MEDSTTNVYRSEREVGQISVAEEKGKDIVLPSLSSSDVKK